MIIGADTEERARHSPQQSSGSSSAISCPHGEPLSRNEDGS